jgi:hypothetical protein
MPCLVHGDEHGGFTHQANRELCITDKVARQMIRHGMIATINNA